MKHIIVIIDGTWLNAANKPSFDKYSNAYAINWLLDNHSQDGSEQVVFYSSGLGASGLLQDYSAGAFAEGIDQQIRDAYINVCSNFREIEGRRDALYVFGFSRGAVAARALSGLISDFGLLRPNHIKYYPKLWRAYTGRSKLEIQLGNAMIKDISVEFLGLFDSVFGARNARSAFKTLQFRNYELAKSVKSCVHLLALDDRRAAFSPMLFDGHGEGQRLEQIWMPGVHADVGGIAPYDFLGRCALETMVDRVSAYTQLKFSSSALKLAVNRDNLDIHVNNERAGLWRLSWPRWRRPDPRGKAQFLHPLVFSIRDRISTRHGRTCPAYSAPAAFRKSPFPTFDKFASAIQW